MSHPVPQAEPQPVGLFVPRALLLDTRLKPMERNAWMVFRSLADGHGVATVSHESLRTALLCAPGSHKAAPATVSRAVLCLRLSVWIEQIGYRRNPHTGFSLGGSYTVRTEPLSFVAACLGNGDYLPLLERGLKHVHVSVRQLARSILDQAMRHPDELAQLPSALQKEVKRLHQQAHSSEDGSGGSSSQGGPDLSDPHISSPAPTFPKPTSGTSEAVRTVQNKVCKEVPTCHSPQVEPGQDALARFRRLDADQQDCLSGRLQALPLEQRRDVLAEWNVRCAAGAVRDAAAYLFGLIRKALAGTFHLWAARKNTGQEQPVAEVRETPRPPSTSGTPATEAVYQPVSREVASVYLQRMKAMLQDKPSAAPVRATKQPQARRPQAPLVRAVAQAVSSVGQPRPLADFLTPIMEAGR
ncbi:MAG: hypothetical protein LBF93_11165 [Zoogloeaceae bacterium]|jgi:hypothetical protein|nr:hypothetical protein [Zoogloeaceae bacterium]